jgi:hypothetical protein
MLKRHVLNTTSEDLTKTFTENEGIEGETEQFLYDSVQVLYTMKRLKFFLQCIEFSKGYHFYKLCRQ